MDSLVLLIIMLVFSICSVILCAINYQNIKKDYERKKQLMCISISEERYIDNLEHQIADLEKQLRELKKQNKSGISKDLVLEVLVSEYNNLYAIVQRDDVSFSYKRELEDQAILLETIAERLNLIDEFEDGKKGEISWKK